MGEDVLMLANGISSDANWMVKAFTAENADIAEDR
jgi:hypothetical protein